MNQTTLTLITVVMGGVFSLLTPLVVAWVSWRLNQIHTLVNSSMTLAKQTELASLLVAKALMLEVFGLKKDAGAEPDPTAAAAVEAISKKISEVQIEVDERLKAQKGA